jgi:hypothetical protein
MFAASAKVQGLTGKKYLDKSADPKNPTEKTEDRDAVTFGDALVDSVYQDAPERVVLEVGTGKCQLHSLLELASALSLCLFVFLTTCTVQHVRACDGKAPGEQQISQRKAVNLRSKTVAFEEYQTLIGADGNFLC